MDPDAAGQALLGSTVTGTQIIPKLSIDTPRADLIDTVNKLIGQVNSTAGYVEQMRPMLELQEYTPVMSNSTNAIGDGTLTGRYIKLGRFIWFEIVLTFGTATVIGTDPNYPYFSVPEPMYDDGLDRGMHNNAWFSLSGSTRSAHDITTGATSSNFFGVMKSPDNTKVFINWDSTSPTPATYQTAGDIWHLTGMYPTAE